MHRILAIITPQSLYNKYVVLNKIHYYIKTNKLKSRIQKNGPMLTSIA